VLGLELAVKSGGHSIAGHSSGTGVLLVEMSGLKQLEIDLEQQLVHAEAGLTAGEVTTALATHGLEIPFGDTPSVGIAGLTLGGGIGYLVRRDGLAIDHLVEVEMVTADGRIIVANEARNVDLFWAVRGGGGNFGIVTRFTYRPVALGTTYGGGLILPATPAILMDLVRAAEAAPRELSTIFNVMPAPPMPFLPESWVGRPVVIVLAVYAGDPLNGPEVLAPFRAVAEPLADLLGPMPYPAIYDWTQEAAVPAAHLVRSAFLTGFDLGDAHRAVSLVEQAPGMVIFHFRVLGGAMADVPAGATAFAHRDAGYMVAAIPYFGDEGGDAPLAWADSVLASLRPKARGAYSNFLGDEGDERIREAYTEATYARLAAIKRAWDPTNAFRRNQNIRPAG
jgi:FAD/FMN-containing dehydrogenase